jgi:DNA modification methylase
MNRIFLGDTIEQMRANIPNGVAQCVVTSPPYWGLRDYGVEGQIGNEATPGEFVEKMVEVFGEVWRCLVDDGVAWVNLGDSWNAYNGGAGPSSSISSVAQTRERPRLESGFGLKAKQRKPKEILGIPWRVAFALQDAGWYLRQCIIWHKPNPMPESVTDRCTKAHEYVFLMSKSQQYYYDNEAIKERTLTKDNSNRNRDITKLNNTPGRTKMMGLKTNDYDNRNKRSVWTVATQPFKEAHFAVFPPDLIKPMILAGCPTGGVVLDPFVGSGTTAIVARELGRRFIGIELNPEYADMASRRVGQTTPCLFEAVEVFNG